MKLLLGTGPWPRLGTSSLGSFLFLGRPLFGFGQRLRDVTTDVAVFFQRRLTHHLDQTGFFETDMALAVPLAAKEAGRQTAQAAKHDTVYDLFPGRIEPRVVITTSDPLSRPDSVAADTTTDKGSLDDSELTGGALRLARQVFVIQLEFTAPDVEGELVEVLVAAGEHRLGLGSRNSRQVFGRLLSHVALQRTPSNDIQKP